ncbi:sugar ABC transporter permease [Clostridium sp. Marseille-Q2269]|uniref:carbohydrate ABC transporter permease n=1 Tax=Clostridium sp. Marseille-Q2269 TaxID=2942205 RepID=UPI00207412B7|nr:sugar ABC transporter permease [Clostridium sp. Marseille-Q2269]
MKRSKAPYVCLLPLLFILVIFVALPLCITIVDSLYEVNLRHLDQRIFVGWGNYITLFQDKFAINSFGNSLFYLIISLIAETILGIVLALALKDKFIGRGIILAVLIIPWALPPLVNGIIWRLILDPTCGLWNDFLFKIGFIHEYKVWLNNPAWSKWLVTLVHVWKMLPLIVIIFLAKLQTLPEDRIEAASIDGANYWQRFRYIIFPFIKSVLVITLAEGTISAFHLFDEAYIMTGTALDTRSLLIENYLVAFREMNLGSGMALSMLISLFSLLIMSIYIKLGGKNQS